MQALVARSSGTCATARPRSVQCRASAIEVPGRSVRLEDVACPCVAAVDVMAAKTKCIHPDRPISKACADCPRRKGKAVLALETDVPAIQNTLQVFAAKSKCVHPERPISKACADCPRRKGKAAGLAIIAEAPKLDWRAMAAKTKCIHPDRPISKACPDCPRRK